MALFRVIVCLLFFTAVHCAPPDGINLKDPLQISRYVPEKSLLKNPELASRGRKCGGTGKVIALLYEGCKIGDADPCVVPHKAIGRAELIFVPSVSTTGLGLNTRLTTSDGQSITFKNLFPELSVVAGQKYSLTTTVGPVPELKGKHFSGQWEIFRMADKHVEICSEHEKYVI